MQWLIDLVIAWIYKNGIYRDAGDYAINDFILGNLNVDGNWHELDLSDIVDEHTKACNIRLVAEADTVEQILRFRKGGHVQTGQKCELRTQVANIPINAHFVLGVSEDRKIGYQVSGGIWDLINIKIRGWWL